MKGVPFGFVAGRTGLPNESTAAIVGVAPVVGTCSELPLFQPSKYLKIPFRAHGVSTVALLFVRVDGNKPFHRKKKNVLFLTIGPPMLPVYSFRLVQAGTMAFGCARLLTHEFGSIALFLML